MGDKRQSSKIFVGGLSWETTDQRLRTYFENYGAVSEAFVSFDRLTGRPRGFGFVVFDDPVVADKVVSLQHTIDRRDVEAKKAVPKEEHPAGKQPNGHPSQRTKKIFVGGLAPSVDEQAFRKYFEQYGAVDDAVVMYDHDNKRPRGFGFVTFTTEEGVDAVFTGGSLQTLHDKPIEIKRAVPRDQIATARGRPSFSQQTRLFPGTQPASGRLGQSGFAAAAMGPAFSSEGAPLHGSLLSSHSLGVPNTQSRASNLSGALSLGTQGLPQFSHDLGALSQGLAVGILSAMSGQFNGQLASSANGLQSMGSTHLADLLRPMGSMHMQGSTGLHAMGSGQPQGMGSNQLQAMGSTQSASSSLMQGSYSLSNGDILGADFNPQSLRQSSNGYPPVNRLETAFAGVALEPQQSFGTELPPPNGFEERVNMLSAGSAGLGQLPSPKIATPFPNGYADSVSQLNGTPRDVAVSSQQW